MTDSPSAKGSKVFKGLIAGSPIHRVVVQADHPAPPGIVIVLWMDEFSRAVLGVKMIATSAYKGVERTPPLIITVDSHATETKAWIENNLLDSPVSNTDSISLKEASVLPLFGELVNQIVQGFMHLRR